MAMAKKEKLSLEELLEKVLVKEEESPYEVPGNWVWTKLGEIAEFSQGVQVSVEEQYKEFADGRVRFIRIIDYTQGTEDIRYITLQNKKLKSFVNTDDIVMVRYGATAGFVGFGITGVIANNMFKITPYEKILSKKYLYTYLKSPQIYDLLNTSGGSTAMPAINFTLVSHINVPVPTVAEQQRIVQIIESLFEKLDTAKELVRNALDSFENRKAAILHKAFTGELTAKWREENGVSLDDWEENELGKVITYSKEKADPLTKKDNLIYIGLEHIEKNGGLINTGSSEEVKSLKTVFRKGDILYGKLRPYLNKHIIVDFDGICSTDILVIRPKLGVLNRYINYILNMSSFIDYAVSNSKGINLPRISEKEVSNYKLNIPSVEEQKEIVRILDNLLQNEQKAKELSDVIEKIDLMKKAILAMAFRGELGTNNPEEVSAVELLKEVLKEKI